MCIFMEWPKNTSSEFLFVGCKPKAVLKKTNRTVCKVVLIPM